MVFAMDSAAPPFASVSILVRIMASTPMASSKTLACSMASFPANASPTKIYRSGMATLAIFFI